MCPQLFEGQLDAWMAEFHQYLSLPDNPALAESDPEKEGVMDAVRSAVCHNINLVGAGLDWSCFCTYELVYNWGGGGGDCQPQPQQQPGALHLVSFFLKYKNRSWQTVSHVHDISGVGLLSCV